MRSHVHVIDCLAEFVAGTLPPHETQRVENHVRTCESCAAAAKEWRRLAVSVREVSAPTLNSIVVRRITARAQARRIEILERRRFHGLVALFAISAWIAFLISVPILSQLSIDFGKRWHWSPSFAVTFGLAAWGTVCWALGISLIPILRMQKSNGKETRQ
ncbi:MAG: zf-HC2 domain-containing protein [Acidobacteriia bacterium]|nr:zf-HC2 domain-containing protein [Terriglobia bacterium]